jgi:arabinogalactan oligomer / maltooligosaccharide transport system substrate-binding protein
MKKTFLLLISLMLTAAFLLGACGPTAAPEPPTDVQPPADTEPPADTPASLKGTVTLWHSWKDNEIASLNEVIAAFQAMYPDVQFDVLYAPHEDLQGKYETAAATGGGPSVLIGSADWGPGFFDADLIADISGLADAAFLGTINEAALGAVEYKGALIGLPQTVKGVIMFRNKTIIPTAPATIDELIAAAQAATAGDILGANLEYGFFFSAAHLDGVGGALMDENGYPAFNDAKGVEWVELVMRFKDAGPVENYTDNDVNLFKAGKVGIIIDGSWNMASLAEAIGAENLAIDPWPAPLSGYAQTENIYLNANATGEDKDAAWAFMKFFLSPEAQAILADASKAAHIPATKGVAVTDPLMQQAAAAFETGAAFPVIPEMGAYWDPMNNMLKKVLDEGVDPAVALQEAFDAVTAKVKEIRGE